VRAWGSCMVMGKLLLLLLVSCSKSFSQVVVVNLCSALTGLDIAKKSLRLMMQQKLLHPKQDEMGLVLCGTQDTSNDLNSELGEGYENISVRRAIAKPDLDMLEDVDNIVSEPAEGDVISALLVAMGMVKDRVKKLKFQKRIFLITDAAGEIVDDEDAFEQIVSGIIEDDYKINIIGIGFSDVDDDDDEEIKPEKKEGRGSGRTERQVANEALLRKLAKRVGGAVFSCHTAIEMLSYFRSRSINQTTLFRGPLQIGNDCTINVWSYAKTKQENMPSLKKHSQLSEEAEEGGSGAVKMSRTYWNKKSDSDFEVGSEDRIRGYKYGTSLVPWPETSDPDLLKFKTTKSIKVLGFCKKTKVPRYEMMSSVDLIVAEPGNESAGLALSALIHGLAELDQVALVRYVKRKNSAPVVGILTPVIKPEFECLYFCAIPYAEDVREFEFASFSTNPAFVPSKAQLTAAEKLIESMDLMKDPNGDDEDEEEQLKPTDTFNPVIQRFYQSVEVRALDPSAPIPELDPIIANYVNPAEAMLKKADAAFKRFADVFKFEKVEEKKGAKRAWRDFFAAPAQIDSSLAELSKRARVDEDKEDADINFADIVSRSVEKIGTVDPVKDFKEMMSRRDDQKIIDTAIEQMASMVRDLVKTSFGAAYHNKALDCLNALRQACVQESESEKFNNHLVEMKKEWQKKSEAFWRKVVENDVRPIDTNEDASSNFTKEQARKFLHDAEAAPVVAAAAPSSDDADDLFASME